MFQESFVDMKIVAITIGILGALLGVYYREYVRAQKEEVKSATILKSNLFIFLEMISEDDRLGKILLAGSALDSRYKKSILTGNDSSYKELKLKLDKIEEHSNTQELITDEMIQEMLVHVGKFSKEEIEVWLQEIDRRVEDIEHGTGLLGREDIKNLDHNVVHRVLKLKRNIIEIYINVKALLICMHSREDADIEMLKKQILLTIRKAIEVTRHIFPLMEYCNRVIK